MAILDSGGQKMYRTPQITALLNKKNTKTNFMLKLKLSVVHRKNKVIMKNKLGMRSKFFKCSSAYVIKKGCIFY